MGGSCESLAGRRCALPGPLGSTKLRLWFWVGARSEPSESMEF